MLSAFYGELVSYRSIQSEKEHTVQELYDEINEYKELPWQFHPYVGSSVKINPPEKFPLTKSDDKVLIGITGGSVALFFNRHTKHLKHELQDHPYFEGKEIQFIPLAVHGHKQPQQYLLIGYLLSLGREFDMILNIDGYNEIGMAIEQMRKKINPFYPRFHSRLIMEKKRSGQIRDKVGVIRNFRIQLSSFLQSVLFKKSFLVHTVWVGVDSAMFEYRNYVERNLKEVQGDSIITKTNRGPVYPHELGSSEFIQDMADVWIRSSIMLHELSEEHSIRYYHFLQPSQYVPGSKPLSEWEEKHAYNMKHYRSAIVRDGYDILRKRGQEIQNAGVEYHDLTMMFRNETETTYKDDCCHLQAHGNHIMAKKIGEAILQSLD